MSDIKNSNMAHSNIIRYSKSFDIYSRNIGVVRYSYNEIVTFGQKVQRSLKLANDEIAIYTQKNPINKLVEQLIVYADRVDVYPDCNCRDNVISIPTVAYPLTSFNIFA